MTSTNYTRLPGTGLGRFFGQPSLWLAGDHVLKVTVSGYSEEYRRFYLADVRGFVVRRTNAMLVWMAVLGVLFAGFGLGGFSLVTSSGGEERTWGAILLAAAVISLAFFIGNLVKGPSCEFYIKTAIQADRIKSVGRIKSADKLIEVLTPQIMEAQQTPVVGTQPIGASSFPGA